MKCGQTLEVPLSHPWAHLFSAETPWSNQNDRLRDPKQAKGIWCLGSYLPTHADTHVHMRAHTRTHTQCLSQTKKQDPHNFFQLTVKY